MDHQGEVLEAVVTAKRKGRAQLKLLKRVMKNYGQPRIIATDRFQAYSAAMDEIAVADRHAVSTIGPRNSHQPFRRRERATQGFRGMRTRQRSSRFTTKSETTSI
jgi:putative transposase